MSWLSRNSELQGDDWRCLEFDPAPNEAFTISRRIQSSSTTDNFALCHDALLRASLTSAKHTILSHDADLEQWLNDADRTGQYDLAYSSINLLLARRRSELVELPFTEEEFATCQMYNCRTAASWEGDMAMSVTFFPETLTTNVVWYGCNLLRRNIQGQMLTDAEVITTRLSNFDGRVFHPMLLPILFADYERERQVTLVKQGLTEFVNRINDLTHQEARIQENGKIEVSYGLEGEKADHHRIRSRRKELIASIHEMRRSVKLKPGSYGHNAPKTSPSENASRPQDPQEHPVLLWQEISFLRIGLHNWQTQLRKMLEHVNELDSTNFGMRKKAKNDEWEARVTAFQEVGSCVRERLQVLIDEYDEFIRQCNHIMEGLTLATQLEQNNIGQRDARTNQEISRVNLVVAKMARHDGSLMKSIAILGMVFLPATFVSTFFSMGFFEWTKDDGKDGKGHEVLSSWFWVYVVVAVGLTILTIAIFYICALRKPRTQDDEDYKMA
ncbi:hypothetical protein FSARC_7300 [Fusarium sarcochroum]|uniref:Uncharacterized protein n=1 Tax=Fusarium sarcochroum TaxID=1208366 RepID=A0A8H4TVL5_9HYPO|nr:hypothetical protein FSARC_7300 [Fusarium sarcochroum]